MKATRTLTVCLLALGLAVCAFGSGTAGAKTAPKHAKFVQKAEKQEEKSEKKAFKQQIKSERAACKANNHSAACHNLKQRQKMEKRDFKAEEKAEKQGLRKGKQ